MIPPTALSRLRPVYAGFVITALAVACFGEPASSDRSQMTHAALRKFAQDALADGTVEFTKPEIRYEDDAVGYNLGGVHLDQGWSGPLKYPLQDQFAVELIRKYQSAPEQRRNWAPYLERVERVIDKELALIDRFEREHKEAAGADPKNMAKLRNAQSALEGALKDHRYYAWRILMSYIDSIAESRGQISRPIPPPGQARADEQVAGQDPAEKRYTVKVVTRPEGATVYYLPEFEYRLKERAGQERDLHNWRAGGQDLKLSGNYRFLARWADSGKSAVSAKVPVDRDITITLEP